MLSQQHLSDPGTIPYPSDGWWQDEGTFPGSAESLIGVALQNYFRALRAYSALEAEDRVWQTTWDQHWWLVYREDPVFGGIRKRELSADSVSDYLASEGWLTHNRTEYERRLNARAARVVELDDARTRVDVLLWGKSVSLENASLAHCKDRLDALWPLVADPFDRAGFYLEQFSALSKRAVQLVGEHPSA